MQSGAFGRMKTGVLLAASLLLLCGAQVQAADKPAPDTSAPAAISSNNDLIQWMTYYYMHPQPNLLVPALVLADSSGLIDQGQAPLTAFVSRVFAQNPDKIQGWCDQLGGLSNKSKPMLWSALWWSGTVEGKQALDKLMATLTDTQKETILGQMGHAAQPIEQMEIKSPEVLDELWGAYSATGDEKYINRLLTVLPWLANSNGDYNKMTIGSAAKWSLASNAQQHSAVLKACIKARNAQPDLRPILDQIISEATKGSTAQTESAKSGKAL